MNILNDLMQKIVILENLLVDLSGQINYQNNVQTKHVVIEVLNELNKVDQKNINTFDDLLLLNAKMTLKSQEKHI